MAYVVITFKPKEVANDIKQALERKQLNPKMYSEWHMICYQDNIWRVDVELHPYNIIRWWVAKNTSKGCNYTVVDVYRNKDDSFRYESSFDIPKKISGKILEVYKYLNR